MMRCLRFIIYADAMLIYMMLILRYLRYLFTLTLFTP
jgi:hypothetical protein